jgi:hypothetical protein
MTAENEKLVNLVNLMGTKLESLQMYLEKKDNSNDILTKYKNVNNIENKEVEPGTSELPSKNISNEIQITDKVRQDRHSSNKEIKIDNKFASKINLKKSKKCLPITSITKSPVIQQTHDLLETRLVGDSTIRSQLQEFCGRNPLKRKRFCYPEAKVTDIEDVVDEFCENMTADTLLLVQVGTKEVESTRSEELLDKYKKLMKKIKRKSSNIIFTSILPRIGANHKFYSKAHYINNSLSAMCIRENIQFLNVWNNFYDEKCLFSGDGQHLNVAGAARLGRLLDTAVKTYQSKNGVGQTILKIPN